MHCSSNHHFLCIFLRLFWYFRFNAKSLAFQKSFILWINGFFKHVYGSDEASLFVIQLGFLTFFVLSNFLLQFLMWLFGGLPIFCRWFALKLLFQLFCKYLRWTQWRCHARKITLKLKGQKAKYFRFAKILKDKNHFLLIFLQNLLIKVESSIKLRGIDFMSDSRKISS